MQYVVHPAGGLRHRPGRADGGPECRRTWRSGDSELLTMVVSQRRVPPGVLFTAQTPFKHVLQGQTQPHENSRGGTGASPDDLLAAPHR